MFLHFLMILCLFTFPYTIALGTLQGSNLEAMNNIAKPNCQTHCGNIAVPYPFGIGNDTGCSLNETFSVTCNSTHYDPPKLFIGSGSVEVYNITESELRIFTRVSYACYNRNGTVRDQKYWSASLPELFTLSRKNVFTVIGCDEDLAAIIGKERDDIINVCFGVCSRPPDDVSDGKCSGKGCCQTSITEGLSSYNITLRAFGNHSTVWNFNPCGYAFLSEDRSFEYRGASDLKSNGTDFVNTTESTVPVVLDWVIARNRSCSEATECKENSSCYNVDGGGYRCKCNQGYEGNPYLDPGCQENMFTVIGCDDLATISETDEDDFANACFGICSKVPKESDGLCSGKGCCQTSLSKDLTVSNISLLALSNHSDVWDFNPCGYAFLHEGLSFLYRGASDLSDGVDFVKRTESTVIIVLDWVIAPNRSCSEATECKENSSCRPQSDGYRCRCNQGYEGNPYLDQGCQDINECHELETNCYGVCKNIEGTYDCTCGPGYSGNATTPDGCRPDAEFPVMMFTLGVVLGIGMLVLAICMYKLIQKRKENSRRQAFFKRNGGLLLQQQTSNGEHASETTRLFSAIELEKATDQYNENRILGRGGQGTVYKGMLPNGKIVAIKKSMLVEESQIESFINEVFLLSQISHRNVVKLLGCCLETEVPILVYEFVSNGDLCQFIHDERYEFPTFWSIRLQIATEVVGALAYMHYATSVRIYHRDIKSSNILLDDKFRAKLSDFGISKSVLGDQTHLSTIVKGTFGYLDPEYFQSNQFTEKSDVYSFGIVLVELLTGKKAIYSIGPGESRSLATFILSTDEGLLLENVDNRVLDGPREQLVAVAKLAKRCINLNGKMRPNMKEVATELEGIRSGP